MDNIHLIQTEALRAICHADFFSGIGLMEQKMLADKSIGAHCAANEIIIEQGEIGDKLYIIVSGQMLVSIKDLKVGHKKINILGPGDIFGEIAILRKIPRTARVSAITACKFLSINAHDFFDAYQHFPPKARDNMQLIIAKRLAQLHTPERKRFY